MKVKKHRNAWDLTLEEFEAATIPFNKKKGIHKSLNGKYTIEFKRDKNSGSAGLAHTYTFYVNGVRKDAVFNYAQKLMLELPDDYGNWLTLALIQEYAVSKGLMSQDDLVAAVIDRKKKGVDCNEFESANIKGFIREHIDTMASPEIVQMANDIKDLFPLEYSELIEELEGGK